MLKQLKRLLCSLLLVFSAVLIAGVAACAASADPSAAPAANISAALPVGASGYHLIKKIPIPGDTPWDYMSFERSTGRLFITHGTHVNVIDVNTGKEVGDITGLQLVHGVVFAPEFNRGFITDGKAAQVVIFDLTTLKVIGRAPAQDDADGEVYDPASKRVFTTNGDSKSSTVIDAKTGKVVGTIDLGGEPEFPVADGQGHVYANIESTSEIVEIDSRDLKITNRWPIAPGKSPSGLAIDAKDHRLFSGCRNKLMVVMDSETGKVITTLPIGQGVDATRFDPRTADAFASNGDGTLTVIHEESPDKFNVVENVPTERGARTMALDPKTHDVFLVTADVTRIPNPPPHTRPFKITPGTFHLLIYAR